MKTRIKPLIAVILLAACGDPFGRAAEISEIDYSDTAAVDAEDARWKELSFHGFPLLEVVAVAKECTQKYGHQIAKNLKGVMQICKDSIEHGEIDFSHVKALPGQELNCLYLDLLDQLTFSDGGRYKPYLSHDVYCREERRIRREFYHSPE